MFDKIGEKIKSLAKIITSLGIILSIVVGVALFFNEQYTMGVIFLLVGSLVSWIGSFVLYGFGELVDKVAKIEKAINKESNEDKTEKNDLIDNLESQEVDVQMEKDTSKNAYNSKLMNNNEEKAESNKIRKLMKYFK